MLTAGRPSIHCVTLLIWAASRASLMAITLDTRTRHLMPLRVYLLDVPSADGSDMLAEAGGSELFSGLDVEDFIAQSGSGATTAGSSSNSSEPVASDSTAIARSHEPTALPPPLFLPRLRLPPPLGPAPPAPAPVPPASARPSQASAERKSHSRGGTATETPAPWAGITASKLHAHSSAAGT